MGSFLYYIDNILDYINNNSQLIIAIATIILAIAAVFYTLSKRRLMITAKETLDQNIKSLTFSAVYSAYDNLYSNLIKEQQIRTEYFKDPSKEAAYCFFESLYSLLARVWKLYCDKSLPAAEWELWKEWLKILVNNDLFIRVHKCNENLYRKDFWEMIDTLKSEKSNTNSHNIVIK